MKAKDNNIEKTILLTIVFALVYSLSTFAQSAPPPPGVPLDFGLTALLIAGAGYGIKKMKDFKEQK
jgi:hypothetical protein